MNALKRFLPLIVLALAVLAIARWSMPPRNPGAFNVHEFGRLPVVADGRVKPLESLARESLLKVQRKQTWRDEEGNRRPAIEWLLHVMSRSPRADAIPFYRIDNPDVLSMLGLEERAGFTYAMDEFVGKIDELSRQANAGAMKQQQGEPLDLTERKVDELARSVMLVIQLRQWMAPLAVPPHEKQSNDWTSLAAWNQHFLSTGQMHPKAFALTRMLMAYSQGAGADSAEARASAASTFNQLLSDYRRELGAERPDDVRHAALEAWFANFEPFYHGTLLYVCVFLLVAFGYLLSGTTWFRPLLKSALWLVILTALLHTGALIMRMVLQGRPPVTNLYASAIFIGWGAGMLGLFLEWLYRNGIGTLSAAVLGASTLLIAHQLAQDGQDTMEMQRAVLDTNFWLATHVTTVTLGYTATFLAGLLAIVYVLVGVFTRGLNRELTPISEPGLAKTAVGRRFDRNLGKMLSQMIYGVICFALLLSFTGTVLGGIWADQSWGRFWGWDPKENGALLIVIWNAIIVHARWAGIAQARGVANMAIFGNVVTAWSWFGTNELGVGLHSYCFTEGTKAVLLAFVLSQLLIIAVGSIPRDLWRSFAPEGDRRGGLIRGAVTASVLALAAGTAAAFIAA